jgi:hypothetical protein
MIKFLKRIFILAFILLIAAIFWGVFAIWTGIYSVYSYPPSFQHKGGATLIVSREQGEPMFNSPDRKHPQPKSDVKVGGLTFGTVKKSVQPVNERTLLELPYVEWAYKKSLEPELPSEK